MRVGKGARLRAVPTRPHRSERTGQRVGTALLHSIGDAEFGAAPLPTLPILLAKHARRVPGAAQHEVVRCRPGTVPVCGDPGSAAHRSAHALHAAPRPGHMV